MRFTFQYGYSKTQEKFHIRLKRANLHSSMVIVKLAILTVFSDVFFIFTFQYGYSKT